MENKIQSAKQKNQKQFEKKINETPYIKNVYGNFINNLLIICYLINQNINLTSHNIVSQDVRYISVVGLQYSLYFKLNVFI